MVTFSSPLPFLMALIFLAASALFAYYSYKHSGLKPSKLILFIAIRTLAVFLLLLLFLEPVFSYFIERNPEKTLIILDVSRSMNLPGTEKLKQEELKDILTGFTNNKSFNYTFFPDSSVNIQPVFFRDSLRSDGFKSDLAEKLEQLLTRKFSEYFKTVILISDGNFDSGKNPVNKARESEIPFICITAGDTVRQKDVLISDVFCNRRAFIHSPVEIKYRIFSYGLAGTKLKATLERENEVVASSDIAVNSNRFIPEQFFTVSENTPGIYKYRISLESTGDEITQKNNYYDFLIEFIDNKIRLLMISDAPGYDHAFLTGMFRKTKNYEIILRTQKTNSQFYEGSPDISLFQNLSGVIFIGFPGKNTSAELLDGIMQKLRTYKLPLIFFAGKNTDYRKFETYPEIFPLLVTPSGNESKIKPVLISGSGYKLKMTESEIMKLPEIQKNISSVSQLSGTEALMLDKFTHTPLVVVSESGFGAFLGYGEWKWRLNSTSDYEKIASEMFTSLISSTLSKKKRGRIILTPLKDFFDYTEKVVIKAEVKNEEGVQVTDAQITGKIITPENKTTKLEFIKQENYYISEMRLPAGDYKTEAEAEMKGSIFKSEQERFIVDTSNREYFKTTSDYDKMKEISGNTNGVFLTTSESERITFVADSLNSVISTKRNILLRKINARENIYILIFIILLFSTEWILKKRNNLP